MVFSAFQKRNPEELNCFMNIFQKRNPEELNCFMNVFQKRNPEEFNCFMNVFQKRNPEEFNCFMNVFYEYLNSAIVSISLRPIEGTHCQHQPPFYRRDRNPSTQFFLLLAYIQFSFEGLCTINLAMLGIWLVPLVDVFLFFFGYATDDIEVLRTCTY